MGPKVNYPEDAQIKSWKKKANEIKNIKKYKKIKKNIKNLKLY